MASECLNNDTDNKAVEFNTTDISCTSCHREVNVYKQRSTFQHPILRVLICKKCFKWYTSGEIEKGEDGTDLQCRWCGDGGDVFCCNNCSNVFCKECITINLGEEELKRVESTDKWCCYVCDYEPLACLRRKYEELKSAIDNGARITITAEDDDEDDDPEESNVQSSTNAPNHWEVKNIQLTLVEQENAKQNLEAFEESVSSLVPISRTLSNSLSYALSQVKRIDLTCESLALGKLEEICNKINSNLSNLLTAFSNVKSSRGSKNRNRKKRKMKEDSLKNGKECHAENGCSKVGRNKEPSSHADVHAEAPRIKLTISKKSLGLSSDTRVEASAESKSEEISNGDVNDGAVADAIAGSECDDENDGEGDESNDEESDKEEEEVSGNSSGDEYNPKKDIRDIKEQLKSRKEKGKHTKTKTAKRSLQKIKEKLRKKKLKIQLEKSKKGGSKDGDDDDEEDGNESDDAEATGDVKEANSKKKDGGKKKKKDSDEDEDGEEHCSKRRKNILDKKLQKFQKSKAEDEDDEENDENDKNIDDSFDADIDKSIRSINRLLKQKFTKGKGEAGEESLKSNDDNMRDDDDGDEGDGHFPNEDDEFMNECSKALSEHLSSQTWKPGNDTDGPPETEKRRKSRVTEDLFMDDSTGNVGNDDYADDGKEGDTSARDFDVSNDDKQFGLEDAVEEEHADADDDDLDNCDDMIEKVIEHCNSKRKKNSNKFKSLMNSDEEDDDNNLNSEDDVEDAGDNAEFKSDGDDDGLKKSKKKKRDRLLAASLLSSDDEQLASNSGDADLRNDAGDDTAGDEQTPSKKKRSRKKKTDDDDEDDDDDAEGLKAILNESDEDVKKKKRRRIRMESSSEDDDKDGNSSDDLQSPSSGKRRKKIHKIINRKKLSKETIDAAKAEEERKKRIEERQKLFNQVTVEDSNSPMKCPITTKLVLEMDPETQEPLIEVHKKVICKLKPHQVEAVKFMWNCCIESLEMLKKEEGSGCILAHCMGLGKTLSVISFVHTVIRFRKLTNLKTCLVLTPLNTILNWDSEFERWLKGAQPLDVYEMSTVKDNWSRSEVIKNWQDGGGVLIMGYDMFRTLSQLTRVKNKKQKVIITEGLLDPGPDIVVCDEGHVLKNDNTGLSKACNKLKTRRRIVLTGTPLQNNLVEYHCMVNFVKPNLLGTRREFLNRFVNPITNGQCSDSTPRDVKIMKNRAHVLHETLNGCVQRRDYSALTKYLLPKYEYVISIRLSKVQVELYQAYLQRSASGDAISGPIRGSRIFTDYQNLMKIWTHPWVLKLDEIRQECRRLYKDDNDSFIDDSNEESFFDSEESALEAGSESEDDWRPRRKTRNSAENSNKSSEPPAKKRKKKAKFSGSMDEEENEEKEDNKEVVKGWKSKSRRGGDEPVEKEVPEKVDEVDKEDRVSSEWWADYLKMEDEYDTHISGKLILLSEILRLSESIGDKVLLFSQSLLSLDLIEKFLLQWDEDPKKKLGGTQGWYKGVDYIRMDGSTSAQNRKDWTEMFNDETNQKVRLFLISTKAGSLGINLVAANRVIIFDASWNPTHDVQSIFRVYRFGQTKPVYVYRFLAQGTMEEKIYERQVLKQSLAQRVIDEHQIERHFTSADLRELYTFKPNVLDPENKQPTPKLPSDRLLAELLKDHDKWVVQYHEHDSLLENRPEEELTEEERKAAWEEYELEKKGLLFRHNNTFSPNLMGQQGDMFANNYFAEVQKFIQALYLQNPGITQEQLNEKAKYFMHLQMSQQQSYMQHQQRERERLMRLQQANIMRQRIANLQNMGPITIDEEPSSSSYPSSQSTGAVSRS